MNPPDLSAFPFASMLGVWMIPVITVLLLWMLVIKGIALWKAARNGHKVWFVALLVINSVGILELMYIFFVAKKYTHTDEVVPVHTEE